MGQKIGRACIEAEAEPFINLPRKNLFDLWESFNIVAEGFGLTLSEIQEMFRLSLKDYLGYTEKRLSSLTEALFHLYDTDHNGLVDSFEFLSSLALASTMSYEQKIMYIFGVYDFEESGLLNLDEVTLAFQTCVSGLTKIANISPPQESEIHRLAIAAFNPKSFDEETINRLAQGQNRINKEALIAYAMKTPEILSWLNHFGDFDEIEVSMYESDIAFALPPKVECENHTTVYPQNFLNTTSSNCDDKNSKSLLPFEQIINSSQPEDLVIRKFSNIPNYNVILDWIYGRNSRILGNSAFYSSTGEIIFTAGSVGVKLGREGKGKNFQNYFMEHNNYISCISIFQKDSATTLVASSECAFRPFIKVWGTDRLESLRTIRTIYTAGIQNLSFSPSGNLLVAIGSDKLHTLTVYEWKESKIIYTSCLSTDFISDCQFLGSDKYFGVCGEKMIDFWDYSNGHNSSQYVRQRGHFGKLLPKQTLTCLAYVGGYVLAGTSSGKIGVWQGRSCTNVLGLHTTGSIRSMHSVQANNNIREGICVGSSDGKIFILNSDLELLSSYNISSFGGISKVITSLHWRPQTHRILVGLESGELFEVQDDDGKILGSVLCGHYGNELNGLATNPMIEDEFATVGSDFTLRIWDAESKMMKKMIELDSPATCISYSVDGESIYIGLGSIANKGSKKEGAFQEFGKEKLDLKYQERYSKETLTDCKHSKDGKYFAFSSMDTCIYIHERKDNSLIARAKGHTGPVMKLDFGCAFGSSTASFLQSNSINGEIMFWNINGKAQTPRSQRHTVFETLSCTLCWQLKGTQSKNDRKRQIFACDRSKEGNVIAMVNGSGQLCLYEFPAIAAEAIHSNYPGHSSNISNIKYSCLDKWLVTSGRDDTCVFQWKYLNKTFAPPRVREQISEGCKKYSNSLKRTHYWSVAQNETSIFKSQYELNPEAEEKKKIPMPWHRAIVAPSKIPFENRMLPSEEISLEWIHGYNGSRGKRNLYYGKNGEIIYSVGRTLVKYNHEEVKKQKFYQKTQDEILCIAMHPHESICALGQISESPTIHCLDYEQMITIQLLEGQHQNAVSNLAFDASGKYLVSIGEDNAHLLVIHDWRNGFILCSSQTDSNRTFDVQFAPNSSWLVQSGKNLLRLWSIDGNALNGQDLILDESLEAHSFHSIGWDGNNLVVGTDDGKLLLFLERELNCSVQAHSSIVSSISSTNVGIASGSEDGKIKVWKPSLECVMLLDLKEIGCAHTNINSLCWENENSKILVGTSGNEIWELTTDGCSQLLSHGLIVEGHFENNLSGLSMSPQDSAFATTGEDQTLKIWSLSGHKILKSLNLEMPAQACTYSPCGKMIAVGLGRLTKVSSKEFHGKWIIVDVRNMSIVFEIRDSRKMITEIKWSPNGKYIAVGSWDNNIYIYNVNYPPEEKLKITLSSVIDQHKSFIRHMDYSSDSEFLRANCGAHELRFFETETGLHVPAASRLKDVKWETQTCTLGWNVKGIWSRYNDGSEVQSVDCAISSKSENISLILMGDNFGRIKLFNYPCLSQLSLCKSYRAHLGSISKVRWSSDSVFAVSIGTDDQSIMVWKLKSSMANEDEDIDARLPIIQHDLNIQKTSTEIFSEDLSSHCRYPSINESTVSTDLDTKKKSRPWIATIIEPTNFVRDNTSIASIKGAESIFCFGFESELCRNNLFYDQQGRIIYHVSNFTVAFEKERNVQTVLCSHSDLISALTITRAGRLAATGDTCCEPKIKIWDSQNMTEIITLVGYHRKGIETLSFSSDSKKLLSIGAEIEHQICVWKSFSGEWYDAFLLCKAECGMEPVLFANFSYFEEDDEISPVTGGKNNIQFWEEHGDSILSTPCNSKAFEGNPTYLCGLAVKKKYITGCAEGYIQVWKNKKFHKNTKAHQSPVNCLYGYVSGFVSGSSDGCILIWSNQFEILNSFDLKASGRIRPTSHMTALSASIENVGNTVTRILFGTRQSEIYEMSVATGDLLRIHEGHYKGQLHGLSSHPLNNDLFVTCGDDGTIRKWSISQKLCLEQLQIERKSLKTICWSNNGKELLVGCGGNNDGRSVEEDGVYLLLDATALNVILEGRDTRQPIIDVKFSPDDKLFAIASMDNKIYIYENSIESKHKLRVVTNIHNAMINSVDFASDSSYIQVGTINYEHIYYDTIHGEIVSHPSRMKDVEWATYTCRYGWSIQGIWPPSNGNTHTPEPTCVDRSKEKALVAVGYEDGHIRIFNNPVLDTTSFYSFKSHVYQVARCCFNSDASHLITIGKFDRAIRCWRITR